MSQTFTIEREIKIYGGTPGEFVSVTIDADSLGLVEIRQHDRDGEIRSRIAMEPTQAVLLLAALEEYLKGIKL